MSDLRDRPTTMRTGEELDSLKLEPFLRSHFPEESGALTVQQYPSGHSNLTYAVSLGSREFVLRRPPFGSKVKSAHDMGREFRVLSKLYGVFPVAPEVLCYCDDESILGSPFYLMKPIRGIILRRDPPPGLQFSADIALRLRINVLIHERLQPNLQLSCLFAEVEFHLGLLSAGEVARAIIYKSEPVSLQFRQNCRYLAGFDPEKGM